jgi:hypothetical protein
VFKVQHLSDPFKLNFILPFKHLPKFSNKPIITKTPLERRGLNDSHKHIADEMLNEVNLT